ncbi:hypothetical protein ES705_40700 [subsurface metagenome]
MEFINLANWIKFYGVVLLDIFEVNRTINFIKINYKKRRENYKYDLYRTIFTKRIIN